jgi:hypothetical protein
LFTFSPDPFDCVDCSASEGNYLLACGLGVTPVLLKVCPA